MTDPDADAGRFAADIWADNAIARILGPWSAPLPQPANNADQLEAAALYAAQWKSHWQRLHEVTADFENWSSNRAVQNWSPPQGMAAPIGSALGTYLEAAKSMPSWVQPKKIARAEAMFMDNGVLSVTLLFCASLPECYVLPDLSAVLNATGQLVDRADHRIRQTGAMIFPVMGEGGLCTEGGMGVAQILKVRLIHATIRNLILRGDTAAAMADFQTHFERSDVGVVAALPELLATQNLHHRLFGMGWNLRERGLPCNQEELAYTLLTFSYVYLRGMRTLGIGYADEDEKAFLHAWNLAGHFLGIEERWMVWDMDAAKARFDELQARGRARISARRETNPNEPDPRPALGQALMNAMESVIPFAILKPFPVLLTRYLCGAEMARDLGIDGRVSFASELLFACTMALVRTIDKLVGVFKPGFAIARWITKKLGKPLTYKLMMAQTRSLKLPTHLRTHIESVLDRWAKG
jgi:ER-bound oxygenase mpaB/B'/Rubber oxygenase, catalytic domain